MEEENFEEEHPESHERHHERHHERRHGRNTISIDNDPDDAIRQLKKSVKKNPWIFVSILFAIATIVLFYLYYTGGSASSISGKEAGEKIVSYLNSRTGGGIEYVSHEDLESLYEVTVSYQGQEIPVFISKDGEYFIQGAVPITPTTAGNQNTQQNQQPQNIPKSDKPRVELFVWGYCPYGVQAQGPLAEVALLLRNYADFEAIHYHDGHGAYESQQNKIQACIQEVAKDKYWEYSKGFVENVYPKCSSSRDIECDKTESVKLMKSLKIDDSKVMSCVKDRGEELAKKHSDIASQYGVTGSPTLVINRVKVNTARTADAFKTAVCEAFNNAPLECSTELSSETAAAAGNC